MESYTVYQWRKHRKVSRAQFYVLLRRGIAPETYTVGDRRYISDEADVRWVRRMEDQQRTGTHEPCRG